MKGQKWTTWRRSSDASVLIGPCGCTVDNNYAGMVAARGHVHDEKPELHFYKGTDPDPGIVPDDPHDLI